MSAFPKPTSAFVGASWAALLVGVVSYFIGLGNATIGLGEKGYYLVLMLYGLFSVVSLQKTVRDQQQNIPVTSIYYGIAWTAVLSAVVLMAIGLWNATFTLSEKGFYGMSYALSLFAATTVQKNIRDANQIEMIEDEDYHRESGSWLRPNFTLSQPKADHESSSELGPEDEH